jgi:hypothetical protein
MRTSAVSLLAKWVRVLVVLLAASFPVNSAAQLPSPNPLTAPLPPPPAPAQLPPPVQPQGLPSLIAVPTPAAQPSPVAFRTFNCSCGGAAEPTSFVGVIVAASFFAARQTATTACLRYNERKEPAAPSLPSHVASTITNPTATLPQGFENPNLAGTSSGTLPGTLNLTTSAQLSACTQCRCD